MTASQEFIYYALGIGALKIVPEGQGLKSGRVSPYFFNSGLFKNGPSLWHLAKAYAAVSLFRESKADVIFGTAYKGIPLVAAVSMALHIEHAITVGYAFNRKEEKKHGDGGIVVGASLRGKRVVIVDDVITSGGSAGEAAEIIRSQGGVLVGCVIAFDRQERGMESLFSAVREFEMKHIIPVRAVATFSDLIAFLEETSFGSSDDELDEILDLVLAYRQKYGAAGI